MRNISKLKQIKCPEKLCELKQISVPSLLRRIPEYNLFKKEQRKLMPHTIVIQLNYLLI